MIEMNNTLFDHIMAGVETLSGKHGQYYFQVTNQRTVETVHMGQSQSSISQDILNRLDEKFLMKIFCSPDAEHDMVRMYDEVTHSPQQIIFLKLHKNILSTILSKIF